MQTLDNLAMTVYQFHEARRAGPACFYVTTLRWNVCSWYLKYEAVLISEFQKDRGEQARCASVTTLQCNVDSWYLNNDSVAICERSPHNCWSNNKALISLKSKQRITFRQTANAVSQAMLTYSGFSFYKLNIAILNFRKCLMLMIMHYVVFFFMMFLKLLNFYKLKGYKTLYIYNIIN